MKSSLTFTHPTPSTHITQTEFFIPEEAASLTFAYTCKLAGEDGKKVQ